MKYYQTNYIHTNISYIIVIYIDLIIFKFWHPDVFCEN